MRRFTAICSALSVATITLFGCATSSNAPSEPGWITLFDGTDLNKWNLLGNPNWRIQDGMVVSEIGTGHLVSKEAYGDFQMRAEFWVGDAANSGIFIRCADPQKITAVNCYEVNINDAGLDGGTGTGGVPNYAKTTQRIRAAGNWNTYEITARGSQIRVVLNGIETVNFNDAKLPKGVITLQHSAGVVKFRNVYIKPL